VLPAMRTRSTSTTNPAHDHTIQTAFEKQHTQRKRTVCPPSCRHGCAFTKLTAMSKRCFNGGRTEVVLRRRCTTASHSTKPLSTKQTRTSSSAPADASTAAEAHRPLRIHASYQRVIPAARGSMRGALSQRSHVPRCHFRSHLLGLHKIRARWLAGVSFCGRLRRCGEP
jgi:hypothetical protein